MVLEKLTTAGPFRLWQPGSFRLRFRAHGYGGPAVQLGARQRRLKQHGRGLEQSASAVLNRRFTRPGCHRQVACSVTCEVGKLIGVVLLYSFFSFGGMTQEVQADSSGETGNLTVVHLSGTPYEIGLQHGKRLKQEIRASVSGILRYFRSYLKLPLVRTVAVNWWLDSAWAQAASFVPQAISEELRGLSDGSGVAVQELKRLHAIPDRTYSCANFAAWGKATTGGRLVHLRNLDWNIKAGIQRYPVVFVVHPAQGHTFVSVAWAGFIGVLTGINDAQVSIGQVGAETKDATFKGEPMVFLMRRVMQEAESVQEAASLIENARRTVGVNYLIADAKAKEAVAIETTHRHSRLFHADDSAEHSVRYARPIADAVLRADTAMDPVIRERQLASYGDPDKPGLEDPSGSSAYDTRYLGQAAGILASYGSVDPKIAKTIARAVAPDSNVQSVVFAWPGLWVANAEGQTPAAHTAYHELNLEDLFAQPALKE